MKEQDLMVGMSRIILNNLFFLDVWLRCSRHTRWSSVVLYMRGCRSLSPHYMVAATCQATWLLLRLSSFPR